MTRSCVYIEKIAVFERRSSRCAIALCAALIGAVSILIALLVGYSSKTVFAVQSASGATYTSEVAERLQAPLVLHLPPIHHQLLSQIQTPDNPIIPRYMEAPAPEFEQQPEPEIEKWPEPEQPRKNTPVPKPKQNKKQARKKTHSKAPLKVEEDSQQLPQVAGAMPHGGQGTADGGIVEGSGKGAYSLVAAELHKAVERHKTYPKQARRIGDEGVATLRFSLDNSGRIRSCIVQGSTGSSLLDKATRQLGEKLVGTVIAAANGLGPLDIATPVRYRLR